MKPFSDQDTKGIIDLVQTAPLQNMKHAQLVSNLLQRFQVFVHESNALHVAEKKRADAALEAQAAIATAGAGNVDPADIGLEPSFP